MTPEEQNEIEFVGDLVVDVDGTICTAYNRDYENAVPHDDVIDSLWKAREQGWKIILQTARGQISNKGDQQSIEENVRPTLETWLNEHSVPYDELQMGKAWARIAYVDDKAMQPEDFCRMVDEY